MKEDEMEKDIPTKAKGILHKMYLNSKASFRTLRNFQDRLRMMFPGFVNKEVKKK